MPKLRIMAKQVAGRQLLLNEKAALMIDFKAAFNIYFTDFIV